ncbi:MAG: outer membrane beta-barrel protein [Oleiphilaceae bacterium]|nr:outer membrane beta-barrel protein [Oleiphilaceae bacterium]
MSLKRLKRNLSAATGIALCILLSLAPRAFADARYDGERAYWGVGASVNKTDYLSEEVMRGLFNDAFFSPANRRRGATSYNGVIRRFDDADSGFKVFWGYSVNKLWDWEVGYVDLGSALAVYEANDIVGPWSAADIEANSWNRGFFGHVQYSPDVTDHFEVMVRLGVLRWDARRESVFRTRDPDERLNKVEETRGSYDEYFGVGMAWHINNKYALRADADRYHLGEAETGVLTISVLAYF